jgi:hypothetical protein
MVLGRKCITRRRILSPALYFSILQQFDNIFNEETDRHVDIFKEIDDQSCVPINPHITQFKLKTIAGGVSLFANTS